MVLLQEGEKVEAVRPRAIARPPPRAPALWWRRRAPGPPPRSTSCHASSRGSGRTSCEPDDVFCSPVLTLTAASLPTDAELYAYSAVWTGYALLLLALGICQRSQPLRYASLAVLMLTVAKVFLYDMSDLTGLFRVASFLGLGVALIVIARVYQRFVFTPSARTPS